MTDLTTLTTQFAAKAAALSDLGKSVKFDFGDVCKIHIDASVDPVTVTNDDKDADATVVITIENLVAMAKGELDPMMAFMQGKMKVLGDMMLAQKLAPLLRG